ncbi:unnamed protein product [Cylicostephanus goldi]|uniref:Uncharacterized protein n=1 Tax=Cylicostephanus goldi TaxID=71465 RepID=A0A3P6SMR0_CYLGO|nr:unnamed protein product [Cylicostephanus goldi]
MNLSFYRRPFHHPTNVKWTEFFVEKKHVRPPRPDLRLVQVSSNVWCTRFSITSMSPKHLPEFLGQVVYKTSVLHLQPRQMTIDMAVLGGTHDRTRHNFLMTTVFTASLLLSSRTTSSCTSPATSEGDIDDLAALVSQQRLRDNDGLTREERAFFDRVRISIFANFFC